MSTPIDAEASALLEGDHRALSRLISLVERGDRQVGPVMERLYPYTGSAYCIGITGPPGVGKSSLVDALVQLERRQGKRVGVVAVDPSSPFSGGALLGDRVRMQRHYLDPGVFIRSIATRGTVGGVPRVIKSIVRLLDAATKDVVLVETVGVGQTELDVMQVSDTVVVTLVPELGDAVQALKAGLMEIADIYVVNKGDLGGADRMVTAIESMLHIGPAKGEWTPPVLVTQALTETGVEELKGAIDSHRQYLERCNELQTRRDQRHVAEFLAVVEEELGRRTREMVRRDPEIIATLVAVQNGDAEPYSAALRLLQDPSLSSRLFTRNDIG
jgi:LAO/AO transport system kinase